MISEGRTRAYGNAEVIQLFENWLKKANEGLISHATVTVCQMPDMMACDFAGIADMDFLIPYVLDTLKLKMGEKRRVASGPKPRNMTADYVCYNLGNNPASFDFLSWLVDAEMNRVREGAPSPLKICFTFGHDGQSGLNTPTRKQMFVGVMRPMLNLIGAVEDSKAVYGRSDFKFVLKPITDASKNGEKTPIFKSSVAASEAVKVFLQGSNPVTITLREQPTWEHRNSDLEEWTKFARYLESRGEQVVFVRDTDKAGEPLVGFSTFPMASLNLDIRMALYEQGKVNLFTPTGPCSLALFGSRPLLMFNPLDKDDPYVCNRPEFWEFSQGIKEGEQFPWSLPTQRIIWKADSYENILEAWEELNDHSGTADYADRTSTAVIIRGFGTESASRPS